MMTIVVVQLVLLTAAVLVLFAMMGELAARGTAPARPATTHPIDEAKVGARVHGLPAGFRDAPGILLVLSTTCGACDGLAAEAVQFFDKSDVELMGMLVSSSSEGTAAAFIGRHGLNRLPVAPDVSGKLSSGVLGVSVSPAAVAVDETGTIRAAAAFTDYQTLPPWLDQALRDSATEVAT